MLPDRVSNPGPLTYESGALPIALRGPAQMVTEILSKNEVKISIRGYNQKIKTSRVIILACVSPY